jgi:hypothetical protein
VANTATTTAVQPPPDPQHTKAAVKELVESPRAVKREIKLDHSLIMSEVQLLLAEKRTAFALLRTGVTVSLVPLSIWTVLVATSKLYNGFDVLWLLLPVMIMAVFLFALGIWLILRALRHVHHTDVTLLALRRSDTLLEDLMYAH